MKLISCPRCYKSQAPQSVCGCGHSFVKPRRTHTGRSRVEPIVWITVLAIHALLGQLLAWTCSKTWMNAHWIPFAQMLLAMAGLEAALGIYLRRKIIYQIGMATILLSIPLLPHGIVTLWLVWRGMARHPEHWN